MAGKDLLSRLADAGEEAIGRLAEAPGAERLTGVANSMRDRIDELQKKVRGIDALEARVADVERRLAAVEGSAGRPRASTSAGSPAPRKPASAPKRAPGTTGSAGAKRTGKAVRRSSSSASEPTSSESSPSPPDSAGGDGSSAPTGPASPG
jgi:hypothetical protein